MNKWLIFFLLFPFLCFSQIPERNDTRINDGIYITYWADTAWMQSQPEGFLFYVTDDTINIVAQGSRPMTKLWTYLWLESADTTSGDSVLIWDNGYVNYKYYPYFDTVYPHVHVVCIDTLCDGISDNSSVFLGYQSGVSDDRTNNDNTGVGKNSLNKVVSGTANTAVGVGALYLTNSNGNTGIGNKAAQSNTTGINNTAIGSGALILNQTGDYNTALGFDAGFSNVSGDSSVYLGAWAGYSETDGHRLYIETTKSTTPLIYGEFDTDSLRVNGSLAIRDVWDSTSDSVLVYDNDAVRKRYLPIDTIIAHLNDTGFWYRSGNYLYPKVLTDSVGIATATPLFNFHVNGTQGINIVPVGTNDSVLIIEGHQIKKRYLPLDSLLFWSDTNIIATQNYVNNIIGDSTYWRLSGVDLYPENVNYDVGIGTTDAGFKLDVWGDVGIRDIDAGTTDSVLIIDNFEVKKRYLDWTALMDTSYWDRSGNYLYPEVLTDSVGIAVNTPAFNFHVNGTQGLNVTPEGTNDSVLIIEAYQIKKHYLPFDSLLWWSDTNVIATNYYVGDMISDSSYWNRYQGSLYPETLTDSVGIGTINPGVNLDVWGRAAVRVLDNSNSDTVVMTSYGLLEKHYIDWDAIADTSLWEVNGGTTNPKDLTTNVGIATTTAAYPLDVAGRASVRIMDESSSDTVVCVNAGLLEKRYLNFDPDTSLWVQSADKLYPKNIDSRVGIGTTSPGGQLHITLRKNIPSAIFERNTNAVGAATNRFYKSRGTTASKTPAQVGDYLGSFQYWGYTDDNLYSYGSVFGSTVEAIAGEDSVAANHIFLTRDLNYDYAERVRFTANGDVGIGTTAPAFKLDVFGKAAVRVMDNSTSDSVVMVNSGELEKRYLPIDAIISTLYDTGFWYREQGHLYPKVITDSVGIGTANPDVLLHLYSVNNAVFRIQDDDHASSYFEIDDASSGTTNIFKYSNTGNSQIQINPIPSDGSSTAKINLFNASGTTGDIGLGIYNGSSTLNSYLSGNTHSYFNNNSGFVGIGTTAPKHMVDVDGSLQIGLADTILQNDSILIRKYKTNYYVGSTAGNGGSENTFVGYQAGASNTGSKNTGIGYEANKANTSGIYTFAGGYQSGLVNDTSYNTFVGAWSGKANTKGYANTYVGFGSGFANQTGDFNTLVGSSAGLGLLSDDNTLIGYQSGSSLTTGKGNTYIGKNAGSVGNASDSSVVIGIQAGASAAVGDKCVFIGALSGSNDTRDEVLYIENTTSSTPLIYGKFDQDSLVINGDLSVTDDLNVTDTTTTAYFVMPTGATNNYLLKCDANGVASWTNPATYVASSGNADSLGSLPASAYVLWSDTTSEIATQYDIFGFLSASQIRSDIHDTADILRAEWPVSIHDSLVANSQGWVTSATIHDTASTLRTEWNGNIGDTATVLRGEWRVDIHDTADILRAEWTAEIHDTASTLRTEWNGNIHDTADVLRAEWRADINDSLSDVVQDGDFTTNGVMVRTAAGSYTNRTIAGTSDQVTLTNGDGVVGNPTVSLVLLKDLVTSAPLAGGVNNIFVGADSDVTLSVDTTSATGLATQYDLTSISAGGDIHDTASVLRAEWKGDIHDSLVANSQGFLQDSEFTSNGLMTRTAAGTYANRTITGDGNEITVTNGDGVSGNINLSIDLNKDLVTSLPLGGGQDNILVGADGDVTLTLDTSTYVATQYDISDMVQFSDTVSTIATAYDISQVSAGGDIHDTADILRAEWVVNIGDTATVLRGEWRSDIHDSLVSNSQGFLTANQTITLSGDVVGSGTTSITTYLDPDKIDSVSTTLDGILVSDNGLLVARSVTADANEITVTNGDGTDGNINLSIDLNKDLVTTSPLAGGVDNILVGTDSDVTLSIADAAADGATKGAASFTAADFNASSGNISIDYTNGQAAGSGAKGFLTSTDWTTFNNKLDWSDTTTLATQYDLTLKADVADSSLWALNGTEIYTKTGLTHVGIGTSNPAGMFEVNTTAWNTASVYPFQLINKDPDATHAYGLLVQAGDNSGDEISFAVQDYSGNTDFAVMGNGEIGIGTTAPEALVHSVYNGTHYIFERSNDAVGSAANRFYKSRGTTAAKVQVRPNDYLGQFIFCGWNSSGAWDYGAIYAAIVDDTTSNSVSASHVFLTRNSSFAYAERARITGDGELCIGTTTAVEELTVSGDAAVSGSIASGQVTITASCDDCNVAGANSMIIDEEGGGIVIGGLEGGRAGQILHIIVRTVNDGVTIEHDENTGNEDIYLNESTDKIYTGVSYEIGIILVFDGTNWYQTGGKQ